MGKWYIINAEGKVYGRFLSKLVYFILGKNKTTFSYNVINSDHFVIINASKILFTGNKLHKKKYYRHSGYPGGIKSNTLEELFKNKVDRLFLNSIKNMLPKNSKGRELLKKIRIYNNSDHPHIANLPIKLNL